MEHDRLQHLKSIVGRGVHGEDDVAALRAVWRASAAESYALFHRVEVTRVACELYVLYRAREAAMMQAQDVTPEIFEALARQIRVVERRQDKLAEEPEAV